MRFERIAIVGVGLIGGSFALAARRAGLAKRITGWDNPQALEAALSQGVIDGIEEQFGIAGRSDADFIYLASPVCAIKEFIATHGADANPGTIITDAGSTKREICDAARSSIPGEAFFVGGHPMAGSHRRSINYANADLFLDAPYAIVPCRELETLDETHRNAVNKVVEVVRRIGGKPLFLSAEKHDRVVARISHLPQLVSTLLAIAVAESSEDQAIAFAGGGFADMTRLAESDWSIWEDIVRTNSDEIATALDGLARLMENACEAIRRREFQTVEQSFRDANAFMRHFALKAATAGKKEDTKG